MQRRGVREMQGGGWGSSSPAVRAPGTEGSGERPPQDQGGSQQGRRPRQGTDPEKQGRGPPWGRIWDKAPDLAQRAWSLPGDSRVSLRRRQVSQRETEEACPALPQCPAQARGGGGLPRGAPPPSGCSFPTGRGSLLHAVPVLRETHGSPLWPPPWSQCPGAPAPVIPQPAWEPLSWGTSLDSSLTACVALARSQNASSVPRFPHSQTRNNHTALIRRPR